MSKNDPWGGVERAPRRYACSRCGLPVFEIHALCPDCIQVVNDLGERARWRSDYSKAQRRALGRRHGAEWLNSPTPVRDQPQPRHEPIEGTWAGYDEDDWWAAAHSVRLPPGGYITHHRREHA